MPLMMEMKRWLCGLILFFNFAILDASEIPEISECQYLNAAQVKCKWNKPSDHANLTLLYRRASGSTTCWRYTCSEIQEEPGENGEVFEFCQFNENAIHETFDFVLADLNSCGLINETCWNCRNIGEKTNFSCSPFTAVVTAPPANLQVEKSTITWNAPSVPMESMLDFTLSQRKASYKLMYRMLECPEASKQQLSHTWEVWYEGPNRMFSPRDLVPQCCYETKVYVLLLKNKNSEDFILGPHTTPIRFEAPVIHEKKGGNSQDTTVLSTVQPHYNNRHSNSPVNKIVIGILITAAFVVIVFMLICKKRFPIKTKVPKPVLMIPLEDLKPNLNSQWNSSIESEVADFFPLLMSRVIHENNRLLKQIPVMKRKSNSFQMLIEAGNGLDEGTNQSGQTLTLHSDRNAEQSRPALAHNEIQQPTANLHSPKPRTVNMDTSVDDAQALEDDAFEADPQQKTSSVFKINENPSKFTANTIAEMFVGNNQVSATSEIPLDFSNQAKLEYGLNHNHDQSDFNSLSPQTNSSGFAEYMDYVTDTSGIPSSSGRVAFFPDNVNFDARTFSNELLTYFDQFSPKERKQSRCFHSNSIESGSTAYSSLPSVSSEYVFDCCHEKSAKQEVFFKMAPKSNCLNCKRLYIVKHPLYEQRRISLGAIPYEFGSTTEKIMKNRSNTIDTLSLDSGCSPDLLTVPP